MMKPNGTNRDELTELIASTGYKDISSEHYSLDFRDLMRYRIEKILMVCSLYDYYTIIEDGHLQEAIFNEFMEMNLYYAPHIVRTYTAEAALRILQEENFDLIITTLRLGDMELPDFCKKVKNDFPNIPLVLLASQSRELHIMVNKGLLQSLDKLFIWSGDRKVFLAIIKLFEDSRNSLDDCLEYGVTSIILIEDSPEFYSAYLPLIYTELMLQSQKLISEGKNSAQKMLRQRARPKILLAETYEEAWDYFEKFQNTLLGIITDLKFNCCGKTDHDAGLKLIKKVKEVQPSIPILLQTTQAEKKSIADEYKVAFIDKNSRTLLMELRDFMKENFGFGDFIFRLPNGKEIYRATNIRELKSMLKYIPEESLLYHSQNNHFSHWLKARSEFELAYKLRPLDISQFNSTDDLRNHLIQFIDHQINEDLRGNITVYSRMDFDKDSKFQIIGEGSLGGKARGLAFIDKILKDYIKQDYFPKVEISIPRTIVLGTEVFTQFMENNDLYKKALQNLPDSQILREFLKADLPFTIVGDLGDILEKVRYPIAVRSSSLLEDAMYQPFAGIYATVMVPNSSIKKEIRFQNLVQAIKFVYASTFSRSAKNYIEATGNRIEEEKMGVILQEMVGARFGSFFYPHLSGVARSYNYYPFGSATPKDGVCNLALGLGKTIVDGDISLQYSPAYPGVYPQFGSTKDLFYKSQVKYWALDLSSDYPHREPSEDRHLAQLKIEQAEQDDALKFIASTYSSGNDMLYEGISRTGPRIINFAPILKSNIFPLNDIVKLLLKLAESAMNSPVEIEFAVRLGREEPLPAYFGFLQVRPMVKIEGKVEFDLENIPKDKFLFKSDLSLGNGIYNLDTILYVKPDSFDASKTRKIAEEINDINHKLLKTNRAYVLIGPGRWGTTDPWLGIPVDFSFIAGAQVIIETQIPNMVVDPSQGSHFFQNMTSFKIAYITIKHNHSTTSFDWNWLESQNCEQETNYLRLIKLENNLEIKVNGQTGESIGVKS